MAHKIFKMVFLALVLSIMMQCFYQKRQTFLSLPRGVNCHAEVHM